ncbi:MAG: endonuclease III [Phycisphaerae bacterium]|nr:endonuclease III [Phycisphaerae bacterium]
MANTTKKVARVKKATVTTKSVKQASATKSAKKAGPVGNRPPIVKRPAAKRSRESAAKRVARAERILHVLRELYADAECALHHRSAYELLVATILSAQCTDERVNVVTPELFRRFPDARALATTTQPELEGLIRSTGFFRNKAKSLLAMAQLVCDEFGGEIPDTMEDLLRLPGVARKTANCVLGTWYGKNIGVVVDTHVGRLALRLGLLTTARDDKDAVKIEQDLMKLFPQDSWTYLSHALIWHGRRVCVARKPKCDACQLRADCPTADTWS